MPKIHTARFPFYPTFICNPLEAGIETLFTTQELRRYTGERGYRMYIAYQGIVYDVTDCPKWRRGMHENLHWPGQELTQELGDAPHTASVFEHPCVKRVGVLKNSNVGQGN